MKKGFFITFEGGEGSGKSTQIAKTVDFLRAKGLKVLVLREPGGTQAGEAIRNVLLDKNLKGMTQETELLLYLAARAQIVREKILPALKQKKIVICDRFEDSTLAYQCFGRGISLEKVKSISRLIVRENLNPNLTFLLDIAPEIGMKRGGRFDRMEKESMLFHRKVRKGFQSLAKSEPKRFCVIDSSEAKEKVFEKIKERLNRVF